MAYDEIDIIDMSTNLSTLQTTYATTYNTLRNAVAVAPKAFDLALTAITKALGIPSGSCTYGKLSPMERATLIANDTIIVFHDGPRRAHCEIIVRIQSETIDGKVDVDLDVPLCLSGNIDSEDDVVWTVSTGTSPQYNINDSAALSHLAYRVGGSLQHLARKQALKDACAAPK